MKAGIIGYGFVGQAVHATLSDCIVQIYDTGIQKYNNQRSGLLDCDIVFICTPTPMSDSGAQDASAVTQSLDFLKSNCYNGTVVVKSTVLYRHIQEYEHRLNICFNPEFLNQNTFIEDAMNQDEIVLGGRVDVVKKVMDFYETCTQLDASFNVCTLKEACEFKYVRNLYGAYQVLFWEMIQDTTGNSRKMSNLYKKIPYQTLNEKVGMDASRGFGGACYPKDVSAWNKEHGHMLTKIMLEYNDKLKGIL